MQSGSQKIHQALVRLGPCDPIPFMELVESGSVSSSVFEAPSGGWLITGYFKGPPDRAALVAGLTLHAVAQGMEPPDIEIGPVPAKDWLTEAYAGFPARRIGRFYVHGSHIDAPNRAAVIPLLIDAATAFGSGEHATTEGCLTAIGRLARGARPRRILDMGTGSGILAIGAAKIWPSARITAIDLDAESARVAAANIRCNRVGDRARASQGHGFRAPPARRGRPFDLILANILARPLIRMAPAMRRRLQPGGVAILSGLLDRQAAAVLSAYRGGGFRPITQIAIGDWRTLILRRT